MKKFITTLAIIALTAGLLLSCDSKNTYDDGFEDGYEEGYWDASIEFEDKYSRGYEDGYSEGYWIGSKDHYDEAHGIYEIIQDAEHYAVITGGLHPEEAWAIVDAYLNQKPLGDEMPRYDEYITAADSLICFYEYFYGRHYE